MLDAPPFSPSAQAWRKWPHHRPLGARPRARTAGRALRSPGAKGGDRGVMASRSRPNGRKNSGRGGEGSKMRMAPHVLTLRERLAIASRCGARRRHDGCPCQQPAMANGRCRLHGGKSTGPKTREGVERGRQAALRHGFYTADAESGAAGCPGRSRPFASGFDGLMAIRFHASLFS
jgi:hypothetical protein